MLDISKNKKNKTNFKQSLVQSEEGVIIKIHLTPNSDATYFPLKYDIWRKNIEAKVKSAAHGNKANVELVKCVSSFFNMDEKDVVIVKGAKSRSKKLLLKNKQKEEIIHRFIDVI